MVAFIGAPPSITKFRLFVPPDSTFFLVGGLAKSPAPDELVLDERRHFWVLTLSVSIGHGNSLGLTDVLVVCAERHLFI